MYTCHDGINRDLDVARLLRLLRLGAHQRHSSLLMSRLSSVYDRPYKIPNFVCFRQGRVAKPRSSLQMVLFLETSALRIKHMVGVSCGNAETAGQRSRS